MKVVVDMPDWVWGRLTTIGEYRGVSSADLVAEGVSLILDRDQDRFPQMKKALSQDRSRKLRGAYARRRDARQ